MAARRLGITELRRREQPPQGVSGGSASGGGGGGSGSGGGSGGGGSVEVVMRAPGLTEAKWADLREVIPAPYAQRLQYKAVLVRDAEGMSPAGGAIRFLFVRDAADTADATDQGLEVSP
jgi:hypothetical protein